VPEQSSMLSERRFASLVVERFAAEGIEAFDQIPDHQGALEGEAKVRFDRLCVSLKAAFEKRSDSEILAAARLSRRQLERLFNNVLQAGGADGEIRGLSAFALRAKPDAVNTRVEATPRTTSVLEVCPIHLRDLAVWPDFDSSELGEHKARFDALVAATETLFAGASPEQVEKRAGVTWGQYKRLFKKALEIKPGTHTIRGFEAFAAWTAQKQRVRTAPDRPGSSSTGLFGKLLRDYPIAAELTRWLRSQKRPNKVTPKALRSQFRSIIDPVTGSVKVPKDEYPHNREFSIRRPLQEWYERVFLPANVRRHVRTEMGEAASKVFDYTDGDGETYLPAEAYDTWQIDEYSADVFLRFLMPSIFGGWEEIDLPRLAVIVVRECALGGVLAWRLVLAKQASAADVSLVLRDAVMGQAKQRQVVEGLDYNEGAGYPATIFYVLRWKAPKLLLLDNALSHLANAVINIVLRIYNGKVDLGQSATPKARAAVESEVMSVAKSVVQQLPYTSGRDPKDPVRSASKRPTGKVDVPELLHTLDCYFANRNGVRRSASGEVPVNERLRRVIESDQLGSVISILADKRKPHFFSMPVDREVKYDLDARQPRSPHINYDSVRYGNSKILNKLGAKGLWLRVFPNYDNLQTLQAFRLDGSYFGTLVAEGKWGKFPHDSRVRKLYLHFKALGELDESAADSPLRALYLTLSKKAAHDKVAAAGLAHVVYYLERTLDPAQLQQFESDAITERLGEEAANDTLVDFVDTFAEKDSDDGGSSKSSDTSLSSATNVALFPSEAASSTPAVASRHPLGIDQSDARPGRIPLGDVDDNDDDFDIDVQGMFRVPKSI